MSQDEFFEDDDSRLNKSARKREVHAITDLGAKLVDMPPSQVAELPIDGHILEAITLARKIRNKHVGFKRQIQYIGKLLRNSDPEPIFEALAERERAHLHEQQQFHALEKWRDRLMEEGDDCIQAVVDEWPHADRQHLRQLIRTARKQRELNKPPAAFRELFKYLRELASQ
ncbi:ribosome biogenesis factor YjgA [Aliidiomarina celeris]|uniref:ribosome biogenesis factor YjgA n=1 Tax=Aliidiomarina celeris TaxID=2249428 RepID=UPI000DEBD521|nr:ribosome biogenesis factor YjgA [Aliidiomarina celeris]